MTPNKLLDLLLVISFSLWFWSIMFALIGYISTTPTFILSTLVIFLWLCSYMQEKESPRRDSSER